MPKTSAEALFDFFQMFRVSPPLSLSPLTTMETPWIDIKIFVNNEFFASMYCSMDDYLPFRDHCMAVVPGSVCEIPPLPANKHWVPRFDLFSTADPDDLFALIL
jgi:hypothetical protein